MGIKGLLPFLKDVQQVTNIKTFKGCTVAVDTYGWLHKAVYGCVEQIAYGKDDGQYVAYCMKYVHLLVSWGLKPILVFDGRNLPAKESTEKERRERRQSYRTKAVAHMRQGERTEARQCLERCIDITPAMAARVMKAAMSEGIDCIVAPYEADAQLAYLSLRGIAHIVVSEDSDLLVFGCERVFFKMDMNGNGILIAREDLPKVKAFKNHFSFEKFLAMCVLSGCDYLPSLPGVGLAKACKFVCATHQGDIAKAIKRMPLYLNMASLDVSDQYVANFENACNTFRHQLVFDPLSRRLVPLTEYPPQLGPTMLACAGQYVSDEEALDIALGNVSCKDGCRLSNYSTQSYSQRKGNAGAALPRHLRSIWDPTYKPMAMGGTAAAADEPAELPTVRHTRHVTTVVKMPSACSQQTSPVKPRVIDLDEITAKDLMAMCPESLLEDGDASLDDVEDTGVPANVESNTIYDDHSTMSTPSDNSASSAVVTTTSSSLSCTQQTVLEIALKETKACVTLASPHGRDDYTSQPCANAQSASELVPTEPAAHQRRKNVFATSFKKDRFHLDAASSVGTCPKAGSSVSGPGTLSAHLAIRSQTHIITKSRYFSQTPSSACCPPPRSATSPGDFLALMEIADPRLPAADRTATPAGSNAVPADCLESTQSTESYSTIEVLDAPLCSINTNVHIPLSSAVSRGIATSERTPKTSMLQHFSWSRSRPQQNSFSSAPPPVRRPFQGKQRGSASAEPSRNGNLFGYLRIAASHERNKGTELLLSPCDSGTIPVEGSDLPGDCQLACSKADAVPGNSMPQSQFCTTPRAVIPFGDQLKRKGTDFWQLLTHKAEADERGPKRRSPASQYDPDENRPTGLASPKTLNLLRFKYNSHRTARNGTG